MEKDIFPVFCSSPRGFGGEMALLSQKNSLACHIATIKHFEHSDKNAAAIALLISAGDFPREPQILTNRLIRPRPAFNWLEHQAPGHSTYTG